MTAGSEFPIVLEGSWLDHIGHAARTLLRFVGGEREEPMLEIAWWHLSEAIDLKEMAYHEYQERKCMREAVGPDATSWATISYRALNHLSSTLAEGREKYGEWNWLYGFPLHNTIGHALDHIWSIADANYSEDHWGHAFCNLMFAIHDCKVRPDMTEGMPDNYYQLSPLIKATLEKHRAERAEHARRAHELGGERVPDGRGGSTVVHAGSPGSARRHLASELDGASRSGNREMDEAWGHKPIPVPTDGVHGRVRNRDYAGDLDGDGRSALGRAVEEARGGAAPIQRHGFA